MTITLNHTIVPAHDKAASAKFFAGIFGLKCGRAGYFAPVKVNKSLTLLFDEDEKFESHHLALERRPRILFRGHQRPCTRAHDRRAMTRRAALAQRFAGGAGG